MIIKGKLSVPPLADRLVERPRLDEAVASLVASHNLVTVYAAAGAGKSTAVAAALPGLGLPVAWLTLDGTDAAPERLLAYLQAAFGPHVPVAATVASDALRQGVPPPEAAGLLVETIGSSPVLLVLDRFERIAPTTEALGVVSALLRYAPSTLRMILISRREPLLDLDTQSALESAGAMRAENLAFTVEETAAVLTAEGRAELDSATVVEATGGWVAGVLFQARRTPNRATGLGGESDGLHAYLASQVIGQLDPHLRAFLIGTSLLPEVTPAAARALGQEGAAGVLAELRVTGLPVAWDNGGRRMRCYPCFRDYLLTLLERRPEVEVAPLRRAYGELLMEAGLQTEAVDEFLQAGALDAAFSAAQHGVDAILDRLDLDVAERWLRNFRSVAPLGDDSLTSGELMLAIAQERYADAVEHADELAVLGERDAVPARSSRAAALIAWCYWIVGRVDDARAVIALAGDSDELAGIRYMLALDGEGGDAAPAIPELTGGPLDAFVLPAYWAHGRLRELVDAPASPWAAAVSAPWRTSALCALGRTQDAIELCETYDTGSSRPAWLDVVLRPELLLERGLADEARDAIARGRELIRERGGSLSDVLNRLLEAKLELRASGDIQRAGALLSQLEENAKPDRFPFLQEQVATWSGMALLVQGRDAAAARTLRQTLRTMNSTGRALELPTAAVFLAEAEWRLGREEAAKKTAGLALEAAVRQESNHLLLQALADFPAVAMRQIELEESADAPWHGIGRSLMAAGAPITVGGRARIRLVEFGQPTIEVNGVEVRARIRKSYELLAYLTSRPSPGAEREELLDALFDGRADDSARSYLRQAVHRLREVLSDDAVLAFEGSRLRLGGDVLLVSDSAQVAGLLANAAHRSGGERLADLLEALAVIDRGEYLAGVASSWVDERRGELGAIAADARHEAAQLMFAEASYEEAKRLANTVLRFDPYREGTWRLLMRIEHATGDEDGVVNTYRMCERAMGEIGMTVSGTTESLLTTLRR